MGALYRHRRWISGWLIAVTLAMHWATAAYACPKLSTALAAEASAMAAMPGCSGDMQAMDPERPQLCKAHCEAGTQSVNGSAGVHDAPMVLSHAPALMGVIDEDMAAARAAAMPERPGAGPPAGSPPLYLTLLVLRN